MKLKNVKTSILGRLASILLCLVSAVLIMSSNPTVAKGEVSNVNVEEPAIELVDSHKIVIAQMTDSFEEIKKELVQEVDSYIKRVAPKTKVKGDSVVVACLDYGVDIKLALAQGLCESHFGTAGLAARSNSVFNVGAFDHTSKKHIINGRYSYKDPNESIRPYAKLIATRYKGDKKTETDLLRNFVNLNGERYATSRSYERDVKKAWDGIHNNTGITNKFNTCRKFYLQLANL